MRTPRIMILLILLLSISVGVSVTHAQSSSQQCISIARQSMENLQISCATGEDGTLCVGFERTDVLMLDDVSDKVGTPDERDISELLDLVPGDTLDLLEIAVLIVEKFSLSDDEDIRGLVILYIGANLPTTLDGQLIYLPLGEIDIENAVNPDEALIVGEIISFTSETDLTVFDGPGADAARIGTIGAGAVLQADAISLDGNRVRILYRYEKSYETPLTTFEYIGIETTAWIDIADLSEEIVTGLAPLPTGDLTPMQAIFLRNSFVGSECLHIMDSFLYVQGLEADEFGNVVGGEQSIFYLNGAEFRLVGESLIEMIPGDQMRLVVLTGFVVLSENCTGTDSVNLSPIGGFPFASLQPFITNGYLVVPQGYVAVTNVLSGENLGLDQEPNDPYTDGCNWTILGPASNALLSTLLPINDIPGGPFNRPPQIPELVCASGVGGIVCEFRIP